MEKMHGGHQIVEVFKKEGVTHIFTLSGRSITPLYDACLDAGIRIIDTRHEQAASHMAEAWSLLTGQPGVGSYTCGPGFTDAVTGIASAHMSCTPMLTICGRSPFSEFDKTGIQDLDQIGIVKPITKWQGRVLETSRIAEYTSEAFRQMNSGRPGPVYLEVPFDLAFKEMDSKEVDIPDNFRTRHRPAGDPGAIDETIALLEKAQKPVIVAGSGVWWSQACQELQDFVEASGIPVFTHNAARGAIPDDHELCFGWASPLAGGAAGPALHGCDVMLALGARFAVTLFFGRFRSNPKIIQVDIEAEEIGKNCSVDVGIVGDVKAVLRQLNAGWGKRRSLPWIDDLRKEETDRRERVMEQANSDSLPMHPVRLAKEISEFLDRDAVVVTDGGELPFWAAPMFKSYYPGHTISSIQGRLGCIGVGIPYALAARLAHPDKQVLLLVGDGSFGFNGFEFDTAMRHDLPFVAVVGNDQAWGMIKHGQELRYGEDRVVATELGVRRYEKVVEAMGGYGAFVENPEDVKPALERAFSSGVPACINAMIDPKIISRVTMAETASYK